MVRRLQCSLRRCWARRSPSHAAGTPAGTNIQNTAQVSYTVGASTVTATSNTSSVTVAEILDAVLTIANATVQVAPGALAEELVFTLTNTGNGTETFNLTALSAGIVGDDFDPTLAAPAIYFDTDNSGDLSGGDLAYIPGVNDPALAADASVRLIVVNRHPEHRRQRQSWPQPADGRVAHRHRRARHDFAWSRRRRRRSQWPARPAATPCCSANTSSRTCSSPQSSRRRSSISSAARDRCRARASTTRSS